MPFLDVYNDNGYGDGFYNVSAAVGNHCHNMAEDVMLVQLFLKKFFERFPSPKGELKVDGVCDPVTVTWIKAFQTMMRNSVHPDGIVSRARSPRPTRAPAAYSIFWLNKFIRLEPDDNEWYLHLPLNPNVPARLRPLFGEYARAGERIE
jgi:peptidoglycan hydrolase-like protein with peptidoglycan-binding domain